MRKLQTSFLRRSTKLKQTISDKTHVMFLLHLAKQRLNCNLLTPLLSSPSHRSPNNIPGEVSWGQNIVIFHSIILLPSKWSEASGNQKKIFNLDGPVSSLTTCTLSLRRFKQRKEILWIVNLYKQIWERNGALRLKCPNQMTGIPLLSYYWPILCFTYKENKSVVVAPAPACSVEVPSQIKC